MNPSQKILVIDDVPSNIQVATGFLDSQGYNILFARDGRTGLGIAEQHRPDLILLDIMMPGMNGIEVSQALKLNPRTADIPIIFITAKNDPESITQAYQAGGVDYLNKPFSKIELLQRVRTHLMLNKKQNQLEAEREKLKAHIKTQDRFLSIIAHDLKNPMSQILGFSDLLVARLKTQNYDKLDFYAGIIASTVERSFNLLENLLSWARAQSGRIKVEPRLFNIHELFEEAISIHESTAQKKGNHFELEIEEKTAYGDPELVLTVLRNLTSNAIKFTDEGTVRLSSQAIEEDIRLSVIDDGVGIPPESLEKLFLYDEPTSQKGTKGEKGTGLGLLICKEFVDLGQGRIWAESLPGKGTAFHFLVPRTQEEFDKRLALRAS